MKAVKVNKEAILKIALKSKLKGFKFTWGEERIKGYKNKIPVFYITINDFEAYVSVTSDGKEILDKLIEILDLIMDSKSIMDYEQHSFGIAWYTYEWDTINPDKKIRDLLEGNGGMNNFDIRNVHLHGERKLEDYLGPRIFGIDKGACSINDEKINQFNEFDLFAEIVELIYALDMPMSQEEKVEIEYALEYLIYQTTRFGVKIPEPKAGFHIEKTNEFFAWFRFWTVYSETLTDEELESYVKDRDNGKDLSKYMPTGDWHEFLEQSL